MQQRYSCPNCGSPVFFGARFCTSCGISLSWPTQQQAQPPPVYQRPVQPLGAIQLTKAKTPKKWYAITTILTLLFLASAMLAFSLLNTIAQYAGELDEYARYLDRSEQLRLNAEASVKSLQTDKLELELDLQQLEDDCLAAVQEAKFFFYYRSEAGQRYGVEDLRDYLSRWEWIEGAYQAGEFDCSEMSACLERQLENEGYNTSMLAGDCPFSDSRHAWLLVEVDPDLYMPVEATTWDIVLWDAPYFEGYFTAEHVFEDIHAALAAGYSEFNWWEE